MKTNEKLKNKMSKQLTLQMHLNEVVIESLLRASLVLKNTLHLSWGQGRIQPVRLGEGRFQ